MVDEADAIEEDVDRSDLARQRGDRLGRAHVESAGLAGEPFEPVEIEIGGDDLSALGGEGLGGSAANPRRRRSQQRDFSFKPAGHGPAPPPRVSPGAPRPTSRKTDQHIAPHGARAGF